MDQPENITSQSIKPEDFEKVKRYFLDHITNEIEAISQSALLRQQAVVESIDRIYSQLKLALPTPVKEKLYKEIQDELLGFGPIQPLLDDISITEIMINGHDNVYIEKAGKIIKTDIHYDDDSQIIKLIDRIIMPLGRRIDPDSPMVDARSTRWIQGECHHPPRSNRWTVYYHPKISKG